jgi:glucose-specific phosphotransferase system IIA component
MTALASDLRIIAPLAGILVPLDQVPDPVFAQKMVGDGISLDPVSDELLAPVSGTVTQLHNAHHALTITTPEGIEVLVHIGLDTVMLRGDGFSPQVRIGEGRHRQALPLRMPGSRRGSAGAGNGGAGPGTAGALRGITVISRRPIKNN